uniref:Hypothetical secreted peptide n=1 Tax=Glossina morsitans morsitans TaxID=37546 RepID=D3TST2_GLOMM
MQFYIELLLLTAWFLTAGSTPIYSPVEGPTPCYSYNSVDDGGLPYDGYDYYVIYNDYEDHYPPFEGPCY